MLKKLPVLIAVLLSQVFFLYSQDIEPRGDIRCLQYPEPFNNKDYPDTNYIDMGMCMDGDTLRLSFVLENTGDVELKLKNSFPSFYLGKLDDQPSFPDHWNDLTTDAGVQRNIPAGVKDTLNILFIPDQSVQPDKDKIVLLRIGIYPNLPDIDENNLTTEDLVSNKMYKIIFRKTNRPVDGFEDTYDFGNVYVNSEDTAWFDWRVQNSTLIQQKIFSEDSVWLSPKALSDPEIFFVDFYNSDVIYPAGVKRTIKKWRIGFHPVKPEEASLEVNLGYHPDPGNPDSVEIVKLTVTGKGVVQNIKTRADRAFNIDSIYDGRLTNGERVKVIDFGKIWLGEFKYAELPFFNAGSLPFLPKDQYILEEQSSKTDKYFEITVPLGDLDDYLIPGDTTKKSVVFKFQGDTSGVYTARYVVESDIDRYNVRGYPESVKKLTYLLKAEVIEPKLSITRDTVDFGYVVVIPDLDCPKTIVDSVIIKNTGNAILKVGSITIDQPDYHFESSPQLIDEIMPHDSKVVSLTFSTKGATDPGTFEGNLVISNTNAFPPNNSKTIKLIARGIAPQKTNVSISRELKARPGRIISVPVLIDGKNVSVSRFFNGKLAYDPSILAFNNFDAIGTASEGAEANISENSPGVLNISLNMPDRVYFHESDTLVNLFFNTYLGSRTSTELQVLNPEFGDGICNKIIESSRSNGLFKIDSVCGLEYKTGNGTGFNINGIYPNPANEKLNINIDVTENGEFNVKLLNVYGDIAKNIQKMELNKGSHNIEINCTGLTPGIYYIELKKNIFSQVKPVIIAR